MDLVAPEDRLGLESAHPQLWLESETSPLSDLCKALSLFRNLKAVSTDPTLKRLPFEEVVKLAAYTYGLDFLELAVAKLEHKRAPNG